MGGKLPRTSSIQISRGPFHGLPFRVGRKTATSADGKTGRGRRRLSRLEPARAALTTAIALYRDMEMTFWLPHAEVALAQAEG